MIHLSKSGPFSILFQEEPPKSLSTLSLSLSHIIFSEALFVDHICRSNGLPPKKSRVSLLDVGLKFVLKLGLQYFKNKSPVSLLHPAWSLSSNLVYFHLTFLSRKWSQILVGCDWKKRKAQRLKVDMGVSENRCGTPKSSILIGFSIIKFIHFGVPLFLETPIFVSLRPLVSGGGSGGLPHTPEPGANEFLPDLCWKNVGHSWRTTGKQVKRPWGSVQASSTCFF